LIFLDTQRTQGRRFEDGAHVALGGLEAGGERQVQESGRSPFDDLPLVLEPIDSDLATHDPREAEVGDRLRLLFDMTPNVLQEGDLEALVGDDGVRQLP
jgi:hypothetical protein